MKKVVIATLTTVLRIQARISHVASWTSHRKCLRSLSNCTRFFSRTSQPTLNRKALTRWYRRISGGRTSRMLRRHWRSSWRKQKLLSEKSTWRRGTCRSRSRMQGQCKITLGWLGRPATMRVEGTRHYQLFTLTLNLPHQRTKSGLKVA